MISVFFPVHTLPTILAQIVNMGFSRVVQEENIATTKDSRTGVHAAFWRVCFVLRRLLDLNFE
jgi:hypothetical protein